MDIILLEDVEKVGDKHEIVTVKDGFGRNYLIPKGKAIIANQTNRSKLDALKAKEAAALEARLSEFKELATKLEAAVLKVGAKAGTSGKIFGSVTALQLSNAIQEQLGFEVDRKIIDIPEEVKELGTYTANVKFHKEVETKVNFEVFAE